MVGYSQRLVSRRPPAHYVLPGLRLRLLPPAAAAAAAAAITTGAAAWI